MMPRPANRHGSAQGFTLVEMLIALLIFSLLAAAGVLLLSFSVRAQRAADSKLNDIAALNRLSSVLSADMAQAVVRGMRDGDGQSAPPFQGTNGRGDDGLMMFVRGGWTNLDQQPRPSLQKVEYRLSDHKLVRASYAQLDGAPPLHLAVLLDGVASVALRFRLEGAWSDRWDGAGRENTGAAAMPQAVELVITRLDHTSFRLLSLLGTGYRPPPSLPASQNPASAQEVANGQ